MTVRKLVCGILPGLVVAACASRSETPEQEARGGSKATGQQDSALFNFNGSGTSGAGEPLGAEVPPETAHECVPVGIGNAVPAAGNPVMTCFYNGTDTTTPAAFIEHRIEVIQDARWIHVRLTFNPDFVDNTYGENAIGWGETEAETEPAQPPAGGGMDPMKAPKPKKGKGGHTFKDLVGSDHAELQLFDASGALPVHFKVDYISEMADMPSGYGCAGVTGGEGKMIVGDADWILGATSSLDRNLNGCGLTDYLTDSPPTDELYTPSAEAPNWDYRVVYEVWVAEAPFGDEGLGDVRLEFVHASPSKAESDTEIVTPGPCPDVDTPPPPTTTTTPPNDAGAPPQETDVPDDTSSPPPASDAGQPWPPRIR